MRKGIKIFITVISTLVLLAIVIPLAASLLLGNAGVQRWAAQRVVGVLSERTGTTVEVGRVGLKLFSRATVEGLYVEDIQGDTLLYVRHLDAGFRGYDPAAGRLRLGEVRIAGAEVRIAPDSTGNANLKTLLDRLRRWKKKTEQKPFSLRANSLQIDSTRFRFQKDSSADRGGAIDFADLDVRELSLRFDDIRLDGDSIRLDIDRLSAREKSGFRLWELAGKNVRVSRRGIRVDDFRYLDDHSELHMPELALAYADWSAFRTFTESVDLRAEFVDSRIAFRTIGHFVPGLADRRSVVRVDGTIDGTVARLAGRLDRADIGGTRLTANFVLDGLPTIEETRFDLDISELSTDAASVSALLAEMTGKEISNSLRRRLDGLGKVTLVGSFHGLLSDFEADLRAQTTPGAAELQLHYRPEHLTGNISLADFQLGPFLSAEKLGAVTLTAEVDGTPARDSMRLSVQAAIDRLPFNGYDYRALRLDGVVGDRQYTGTVASADPNVDFRLDGTLDLTGELPRYELEGVLDRLDLHATGINRRDSVSVLSARVHLAGEGIVPEQMTGTAAITDLTYLYPGDTLRSAALTLTGDNRSARKRIHLDADFVEAELTSRLSVAALPRHAKNALRYYLPSLDTLAAARDSIPADDYYALRLQVGKSGDFLAAAVPGLRVGEGTSASLLFHPASRDFSMIVDSKLIEYKNMYVSNLSMTNRNRGDSIALYLRSDEAGVGKFILPGLTVHGGVRDNRISLSTGFDNPQTGLSAMINTVTRLQADTLTGTARWRTRFITSRLRVGEQEWRIASPGIVWGKEAVDIDRFRVWSTGQEFRLDGRLSASPADTLHLAMTDFDLAPLSRLTNRYGYGMEGRMNGRAELIAGRGAARLYGSIRFEDIFFNGIPLQNSTFTSAWSPSENRVGLTLVNDSRDTVLRGGYRPNDKSYRLRARLPDVDLALLSPVLEGVLSGVEGRAQADVTLSGTGGKPSLDGTVTARDFAATVDFTRTRYRMPEAVLRVENNGLILPKTTIHDEEGGEGDLSLALRTTYFADLRYEVNVTPRRMLALNTTERDNDYFYGKVYASGSVDIRGDRRTIDMDVRARTENNSAFFLPLNGASTVAEADFIRFEDPRLVRDSLVGRPARRGGRRRGGSDLNINVSVDVRPNTDMQLVIDPTIGDIIRANGSGRLDLHIRPREDVFTLSGDYRIDGGNYLFTLMNVLNKRFTIAPGSSIRWTGDPLDALLDVTATYRVRANAAPLTGRNQTLPVDCRIVLSDRLSRPTITFDIVPTTVDTELRSVLDNAMNTQELKMQQFIWLLMSNRFYADNSTDNMSDLGTTATAVTGIEFLTNQFSNWLSGERVNLNLGYTPRSELASNEVEAVVSGEIIRDKLLLEGEFNYNFADNRADPRADQPISGDFYLTYVVGRSGQLRARVFTRTIDRFDENQGLQESGLGLYYKRDFDRWRELFLSRRRREAILRARAARQAPDSLAAPVPER